MTAKQVSDEALCFMRDRRMRNHLLGNSTEEHSREIEVMERQRFRDFLRTKNGYMVFALVGSDNLD